MDKRKKKADAQNIVGAQNVVGARFIVSQLDPATARNVPILLLVTIDQRWEKYLSAWKDFRKDPTGDAVRRLRVATRRLRTLLKLLDGIHPYKTLNKVLRDYKSSLNELDEVRDSQVILGEIEDVLPQFPALEPFQQDLQEDEARLLRKARKKIKQVEPGEAVKVILRWLEKMDGQETQGVPEKLAESINGSFQTVHERYECLEPADPTTIHHVRLAFKKFRYKIEVAQPLLHLFSSDALECLDAYQGRMGAVQDIQILLRRLSDFAGSHPELDLGPVAQFFQARLSEAVSDYMKHKDLLNDFWRLSPGQPFPWRQSNEDIPTKAWNCDGADDPAADSQRPLTSKGRDHMEQIAAALKKLKFKPDLILSSPFVRADQTATILAKEFDMKKKLQFSDLLVPEADPNKIIETIPRDYLVDELVLVGHYPHLGLLLEAFLGLNLGETIGLKKGGICCLTVEDFSKRPLASLDWLLTPEVMLKV